ncbi:MAG: hypothetical protein Q7S51_02690 [Gallionellaceae bacterium]|nr:hypothetical protein [Gallionellaceae bacterium]
MVISLLGHVLVFFFFGLWLHFHMTLSQEKKVQNLEVRLAPSLPPKTKVIPSKKLLTALAPKIAQASTKTAPVVEQASATKDEVVGVALPGAVVTPWAAQNRANNSLFHARISQQNAARAYQQQTMDAQARQQSQQQAQIIISQLQQLLTKRLEVQPAVTGKCMLAEADGELNNHLVCDSSALYEILHQDEKTLVEMLIALRRMGRMLNGFSAEIRAGKLEIILI